MLKNFISSSTLKDYYNKVRQRKYIIIFLCFSAFILFYICSHNNAYAANDPNFVNKIINKFYDESSSWPEKLEASALGLFRLLFILEIAMLGITGILKRKSMDDMLASLVMSFLFGGIILACISNYKEWSLAIMNGIPGLAKSLGFETIIEDGPFTIGYTLFTSIMDAITNLDLGFSNLKDLPLALFALLVGIIILICFVLITAQIIFIKCEAFVAVGAGFILLGFGACSYFRDYAINLMKYIFSVAFKLYVLQLVVGLGTTFASQLALGEKLNFTDAGVMLSTAIILLALSISLPSVASGIVQGAHVSSGNTLVTTATQVGVTGYLAAKTGLTSAISGAATVRNIRTASQMAREQEGNTVINTARNYMAAHQAVKADAPGRSYPANINSKLQAAHERAKIQMQGYTGQKPGDNNKGKA